MCDKAVDAFLRALIFALDWFAKDKILEKLGNIVFSNDDIDLDSKDFHIITFFSNDMNFDTMYLNNINLDDDSFDEDHPETTVLARLKAWCNRYKQRKACKK